MDAHLYRASALAGEARVFSPSLLASNDMDAVRLRARFAKATSMSHEIDVICVKPVETLGPRRIYIRSVRGESYWNFDEAVELLIQLTAAIERADDPTPLPPPERTYAAPIRSRPSPLDIGDLL